MNVGRTTTRKKEEGFYSKIIRYSSKTQLSSPAISPAHKLSSAIDTNYKPPCFDNSSCSSANLHVDIVIS